MKIQEVARRARVSTATVSRTINNPSLVDPTTAKRVWKVIEELRYYPNTQARSLVSGRYRAHASLPGFLIPRGASSKQA